MTQQIGNSQLVDTWAAEGPIVEPDITKVDEGWQLGEQPPHEWMNYLQNLFGRQVNYLIQSGVAEWNATDEQPAGVFKRHNGKVWRAVNTTTNSEPSDANANWAALASEGYVDDAIQGVLDGLEAVDVAYDGSESGLSADNVQAAIDELQEEKQDATQVESAIATRNIATVRQATERGPVDSNGRPDLLESAGGLSVQTKGISASTPLVVVLTLNDDEDYRVRLTSNLAAVSVADNADDQQIALDVTPGQAPALVVTPVWAFAEVAPSSPSTGDVWYNIRHWGLPQEWDGAAWVDKHYSFPLGEASTSSGAVVDVLSWAYKGRFVSDWQAGQNSTNRNYADNIGTRLKSTEIRFRRSSSTDGWPAGTIFYMSSMNQAQDVNRTATTASTGRSTTRFVVSTQSIRFMNFGASSTVTFDNWASIDIQAIIVRDF